VLGDTAAMKTQGASVRAAAAACFVSALLWFLVSMNRDVILFDEGITLFGAARVADGDVPHRDFYTLYGPANFYLLAGLFKIFGPSVLVERALDSLLRAASTTLVYVLVAQAGSRRAAMAASLGAAVWLAAFDTFGYPMVPALAFALASLLCLWPTLRGAGGRGPTSAGLIAGGLCSGAASWFRYDVGLALLAVQSAVLAINGVLAAGAAAGLRGTARVLAPFAAGAAVTLLPLACAAVALGAWRDLLFDVVSFPAGAYATMRSLPLPRFSALQAYPTDIAVFLPPLILITAAPVLAATARARHRAPSLFWPAIMAATLTLVFIAKAYVRLSGIHMAAAVVTAHLLLALLWLQSPPRYRWFTGAVIAATAACAIFAVQRERWLAEKNLVWLIHGPNCTATADIPRLSCLNIDQPHLDAIRYLQHNSAPGERIYAGLGRHDKILLNDIAIYFLADRRAATKWHQMDPGLQTTAPIQQEIIAELKTTCPRLAVIEAQWDGMREPNGSALSSGVTLLDDYLHANFRPVAQFGAISVRKNTGVCAN
jgi:hypothetical protein